MRELSEGLSDYHRQMLEAVAEHGVHLTFVAPEDGSREPAYAYTVGLWESFQQPEVIVFGLDPETCSSLLNAIADEADDGQRFAAGEKHAGLLVDYSVRFLAVPQDQVATRCAGVDWAYEGEAVPVLQLVWPDKEKRWPWEEGVRAGFASCQPLLGPRES